MTKNVLFVCTGNICRSPMAEALFRDLVKDLPHFKVGSAGVSAFDGQPASKHTADILKARGIFSCQFSSRMLTHQLVKQASHAARLQDLDIIRLDPGGSRKTLLWASVEPTFGASTLSIRSVQPYLVSTGGETQRPQPP